MRQMRGKISGALAGVILAVVTGCNSTPLPNNEPQLAVNGDAAMLAGAVVPRKSGAVASLVGDQLGAGGGFLVGASQENIRQQRQKEAVASARKGEELPATLEDVRNSTTADLNGDGFVTLDEMVAMHRAGLDDQEILGRLRSAHQVYGLSPEQANYLSDRGLSMRIIEALSNNLPAEQQAETAAVPAAARQAKRPTTQPAGNVAQTPI
jgi:hypothetical protein